MKTPYILLVFALSFGAGCYESRPTAAEDGGLDAALDGGDEDAWAPWPPQTGPAGLRLFWIIEGQAPTEQSCRQVDLDRVDLALLHPVVDFESWSPPELHANCINGEIRLTQQNGLEPGRYRYKVTLYHQDGDSFTHELVGETRLVENRITVVAGISITQADQ